jgi:hypothetical protein
VRCHATRSLTTRWTSLNMLNHKGTSSPILLTHTSIPSTQFFTHFPKYLALPFSKHSHHFKDWDQSMHQRMRLNLPSSKSSRSSCSRFLTPDSCSQYSAQCSGSWYPPSFTPSAIAHTQESMQSIQAHKHLPVELEGENN